MVFRVKDGCPGILTDKRLDTVANPTSEKITSLEEIGFSMTTGQGGMEGIKCVGGRCLVKEVYVKF